MDEEDVDADELRARIVSVLDPAWESASRADLQSLLEPYRAELDQLMARMQPGDRLKLVDGHRIVIVRGS